jgi:hypothetical protein
MRRKWKEFESEFLQWLHTVGHPPATRAGCAALGRPCPALLCPCHLWPDRFDFGQLIGDLYRQVERPYPPSCTLDIADAGEHSDAEVAQVLGLCDERVSQIRNGALRELHDRLKERGIHVDAAEFLNLFF